VTQRSAFRVNTLGNVFDAERLRPSAQTECRACGAASDVNELLGYIYRPITL